MALLEVEDLAAQFKTRRGVVRAVNGVSLEVDAGETVGLVGESGSGKSVTSLAILGLLGSRFAKASSGRVMFDGTDLLKLGPGEMRRRRGSELAMVFQNPTTSLNPVVKVGTQITEAIRAHEAVRRGAARTRARELLDLVGIADPDRILDSYPHRLSGGMCQRVMIAIALGLRPRLLIADEPTTALDVTIQAQVLELMRKLTQDFGTALILITHDLGVVASITSRVNVMYAGHIVETAPTTTLFSQPRHPYSVGLMRSVARSDRDSEVPVAPIGGQPPDASVELPGCPFAPRCRWALDQCTVAMPPLSGPAPHAFACYNPVAGPEVAVGRPLRGVPA